MNNLTPQLPVDDAPWGRAHRDGQFRAVDYQHAPGLYTRDGRFFVRIPGTRSGMRGISRKQADYMQGDQ